MAARENEIGRCRCPVCGSTAAALRVSAKQLAYVTCNSCNSQIFARSDRSDEKLRAMAVAGPAPEPAPAPPAPTPAPAAAAGAPKPPEPPPPKPAAPAMSWGLFR